METFESQGVNSTDFAVGQSVDHPNTGLRFKKLFICISIVVGIIVVLLIVGAIIWKPILYNVSPEAYLNVALMHTSNQTAKSASNTPAGKIDKAIGYLADGSMVLTMSSESENQGIEEYTLRTTANRFNKRLFVHTTEKTGNQQFDLKYYSENNATIVEVGQDGHQLAYRFPHKDLHESISGSIISQKIGQERSEYLADFITESRTFTELIFSGDEMMQPYVDAFMYEFDQYEMETEVKEQTINGRTAKYKVFRYRFTAGELYQLALSVVNEMEEQGNTPTNEMLVYFVDGFVRGISDNANQPNNLEDAIKNIKQFIIDFRSKLGCSLNLEFYIDGLNVVQTKIKLIPSSSSSIGTIDFNYTIDPKNNETVLELSLLVNGIRVKQIQKTSTKKVYGWIIQTITTDVSSGNGTHEEDITTLSWNPNTGELRLSNDNRTLHAYLKESRNKITFRVDDIAQLLSQSGYEPDEIDVNGRISIEFSKDNSVAKPSATSILDIREEDVLDFVQNLSRLAPLRIFPENDNKVIDNANTLSSEHEEVLQKNSKAFVEFYEADLVFVTVNNAEELAKYADDFYNNNFYGIGNRSSGYIIVCDSSSKNVVIRSFGECEDWLSALYLDETATEISQIYSEQGIEYALDYFYQKFDVEVYHYWLTTI